MDGCGYPQPPKPTMLRAIYPKLSAQRERKAEQESIPCGDALEILGSRHFSWIKDQAKLLVSRTYSLDTTPLYYPERLLIPQMPPSLARSKKRRTRNRTIMGWQPSLYCTQSAPQTHSRLKSKRNGRSWLTRIHPAPTSFEK